MPGWDETSVDELLADPIVRDLMAADDVDPGELRALLYGIQRTIERYATRRGGPTSLAGFAKLYRSTPSADATRPTLSANRRQSDLRKARIALADHARSATPTLGSPCDRELDCPARS
jgi:hypothetical protein